MLTKVLLRLNDHTRVRNKVRRDIIQVEQAAAGVVDHVIVKNSRPEPFEDDFCGGRQCRVHGSLFEAVCRIVYRAQLVAVIQIRLSCEVNFASRTVKVGPSLRMQKRIPPEIVVNSCQIRAILAQCTTRVL